MSKFKNITEIPIGTTFTCLGVHYEMVRQTGQTIEARNRNQWGRSEPGTHETNKVVVKTYEGTHRGWSRAHYMTFRNGNIVFPYVGECNSPQCRWGCQK